MTPVRTEKKYLRFAFAAMLLIFAATSCSKKAASEGNSNNAGSTQGASAAPDAAPSAQDQEANERGLNFIRTRIAQKDWASARQTLQALESRPMTPAQRETVNQLK